jgi:predicted site-specific integrase-resolvase
MRNEVPAKPHDLLTEFARIIAVSYSTAKRMVSDHALTRVQLRPNGRWLIPHSEVERILGKLGVRT